MNDHLLATLLDEPLPYPLASHFKACKNIGELFEMPARDYVRKCIDQVYLSPLERATIKALFEAYLLENA